jgi:hypothetical protein
MDEGASSVVTALPGGWIRKTQKRSARRTARNSIETQQRLQAWAATHLATGGYIHLFSPACRSSTVPHSYEMQQIDVSADPWFLHTFPTEFRAELERFFTAFEVACGYRLWDVEFFLQPDGRVAIVDFDQCQRI